MAVTPSVVEYTVGDTRPALAGTVLSNGAPVNGSGTACEVHIQRPQHLAPIVRPVTVAADGTWAMPWQTGDLAAQGTHRVEVQVTYGDGGIETFGRPSFNVSPEIA